MWYSSIIIEFCLASVARHDTRSLTCMVHVFSQPAFGADVIIFPSTSKREKKVKPTTRWNNMGTEQVVKKNLPFNLFISLDWERKLMYPKETLKTWRDCTNLQGWDSNPQPLWCEAKELYIKIVFSMSFFIKVYANGWIKCPQSVYTKPFFCFVSFPRLVIELTVPCCVDRCKVAEKVEPALAVWWHHCHSSLLHMTSTGKHSLYIFINKIKYSSNWSCL